MTNILYSGGAEGADSIFALCAQHRGDEVYAFSFPGHKVELIGKVELNDGDLELHLESIMTAAKGLKRSFSRTMPKHPRFRFIRSLILRNAWQIMGNDRGPTESVYAVSPLNKFHNQVIGGTAWAIEIAIRQMQIPVYVFDLKTEKWYVWVEDKFHSTQQPLPPTGIYTGIGSRNLTDVGIEAIGNLYNLPISPLSGD